MWGGEAVPIALSRGRTMRKRRRKRRREARRTKDKGRWALRVAQDDFGGMRVVGANWSLGSRIRPKRIGRPSMKEWYYVFDGDKEIVSGTIRANTLSEARAKLASKYPNDVGADGELEDTTTGEVYLPWRSS